MPSEHCPSSTKPAVNAAQMAGVADRRSHLLAAPDGVAHVIDKDAKSRRSIECTLRRAGVVVGIYHSAERFLAAADLAAPSAVVAQLSPGDGSGLALCRELAARHARCGVVLVSQRADLSSAVAAIKLGAVDVLERPLEPRRLLEAVREGLRLAHRRQREFAEEEQLAAQLAQLTSREREIFDGVAAGLITRQIAGQMGISPKTVDVHRSHIARKLRIDSPAQVARVIAIDARRKSRLGLL